jgi:hypothetical protein
VFEGRKAKELPDHFDRTDVIRALESDPVAVKLYEDAAKEMPWLERMRNRWRKIYGL